MNSSRHHLIVWLIALLLITTLPLVPHPEYIEVIEIELGYDSGIAETRKGATFRGGWVIGNEFPKVFEFRGGVLPQSINELEEEPYFPNLLPETRTKILEGKRQRDGRNVALLEVRSFKTNDDAQNILHALRTYYHKYIRRTNSTVESLVYRLDHEIEQLEKREQNKFVRELIEFKQASRSELITRYPYLGNRARRVFQLRGYGFRSAVAPLFSINRNLRSSKSPQ